MVIKLDRLCVWIFIVSLAFMIPSILYVKFIDELGCYLLGAVAVADILVNRNFGRYKLVFLFVAFFAFYILYSIFFVHYNTTKYILIDAIIELKPFLPFLVVFAIAPKLLDVEKSVVKVICVINSAICLSLLVMGLPAIEATVYHVAYIGSTCFICAVAFLMVSIKDDGTVPSRDVLTIMLILVAGIGCTRSKYYGEFILATFFILFYKPGMTRNFKLKHALLIIAVMGLVVAASWGKFSYYFITGNSDTFTPDTMESFARPVLYVTSGLILVDKFPFGSGLASFASYASAEHYSSLYYEYGINNVFGLSEQYSDFICDAYYPTLAQFGVAGVILFFSFFIWVYNKLRLLLRANASKYKYHFVAGTLCICFLFIENVGGTFFVQTSGLLAMILLGFTASLAHQGDTANYCNITNHKKTFKIKI